MKLVLCCVIYSKSSELQTISVHRDCLIHHCKSVCLCTAHSDIFQWLGTEKAELRSRKIFYGGENPRFSVCFFHVEWEDSHEEPSAAKPLVLPIRGDAIYYCIYSRSCFALLSHPKTLGPDGLCWVHEGPPRMFPTGGIPVDGTHGYPMGNTQSCVHLSAQPRPLQRTPDLWLRMDARRCQGSRNGDFLFGGQGINKVCWHFIPTEEYINRAPMLPLPKDPDLCETEPGGWCEPAKHHPKAALLSQKRITGADTERWLLKLLLKKSILTISV